jgi:DNA-directed RNA polymerase specialized sigma24 family protein
VRPSEPGKPDADLVREALAGDREPLAELLRRHWDTAVFLAARVLGSSELGRDVAQEAAIAAMTDLARLRSPDRFGAWFCGIALNVARKWLRQLRSEVPGLVDQLSDLPGPAEAAESADIAVRVVQGPAGPPREVDSRPSDAVNLALANGVPIRVDSKLFDASEATGHLEESSSYPVATADMAAESRQLLAERGLSTI